MIRMTGVFVNHKHKKVPCHHLWSTKLPSLSIISHHGQGERGLNSPPLLLLLPLPSLLSLLPCRHPCLLSQPRCNDLCCPTVSAATTAACLILLIVACPCSFCCCLPLPSVPQRCHPCLLLQPCCNNHLVAVKLLPPPPPSYCHHQAGTEMLLPPRFCQAATANVRPPPPPLPLPSQSCSAASAANATAKLPLLPQCCCCHCHAAAPPHHQAAAAGAFTLLCCRCRPRHHTDTTGAGAKLPPSRRCSAHHCHCYADTITNAATNATIDTCHLPKMPPTLRCSYVNHCCCHCRCCCAAGATFVLCADASCLPWLVVMSSIFTLPLSHSMR